MQLSKQFRKQLGFVILISSSMFAVSSAMAQVNPKPQIYHILVNTDYIIGSDILKSDLPGETELFLKDIGATYHLETPVGSVVVQPPAVIFDPFNTFATGYNNQIVGASYLQGFPTVKRGAPSFAFGQYNEIPNKVELKFGLDPNSFNAPALTNNGTTCKSPACVRFHFGYSEDVKASLQQQPSFNGSFIDVRSPKGGGVYHPVEMASPRLTGNVVLGDGRTVEEYVVVYSEQIDPEEPGVVVANWTEFPVLPGSEQKLSFSNDDSNYSSVNISNTKVLRSATEIPLNQLTTAGLSPTNRRFVAVPSAAGAIAPGETKLPVDVPPPPPIKAMTWIVNTVVNYAGKTYVQARYDNQTDPYDGDTSISETRSLLCIRKPAELANNPIPNFTQSIPTPGGAEKNSWSGGEVFAIPNVVGSSLLSEADADGKCQAAGQTRYGLSGFRMAEFHDGSAPNAGWAFWAQSDDPNLIISSNRYWVKINDQNANPW